MKLSEAIRLGAMLKPQAFDGDTDHGGSCALRAAADALGIADTGDILNYYALRERYRFLNNYNGRCRCPDGAHIDDVMSMIYHLNDVHHWTREQIADWVETVETAQGNPSSVEQAVTK